MNRPRYSSPANQITAQIRNAFAIHRDREWVKVDTLKTAWASQPFKKLKGIGRQTTFGSKIARTLLKEATDDPNLDAFRARDAVCGAPSCRPAPGGDRARERLCAREPG